MKNIFGVLVFFLVGCATYAQNNLTYVRTDKVNSQSMNLVNINEFIQIVNDNSIRTIFYNDSQFIAQGNSLVYTIDKKGYDNLNDYRLGNEKFSGGDSYYLAREVGLANQEEVAAYRQEAYITIADYTDASRLGFVRNGYTAQGNIYGIISREKMQSSLRYANILIYLRYYYNWPQQPSGGRTVQQHNNAELLGNTDIDFLVNRSNGAIKKLNNYGYYVLNIPILGGKESFLYYACKVAQYDNLNDYKNNKGAFSVKNTEAILRQLKFNNIDDITRADANGINNSADYYLTVNYRIAKNDLEANRVLISEIESIKKAHNVESIPGAMMLNFILKQSKGLPFSTRTLINKFNQEYRNNAIVRAFGNPNETTIAQMFSVNAQLGRIIMYNSEGESLYVK